VADASFEVLSIESTARRGDIREVRLTFRVTAGDTRLELARSNVRILTPGRVHVPVEGLPVTAIPAGTTRRFWVRFEIPEPVSNPILSLQDDINAPRGEARMSIASAIPAAPGEAAKVAPLVEGEALDIAGASFTVLNVESSAPGTGIQDIRVTFRVTAGDTALELSRRAIRIHSLGLVHIPEEGLPVTTIPAGTSRQFWVRFDIREPLRDPVLSLRDDANAPRGEVHRALTGL
jgi:hypothetical protein